MRRTVITLVHYNTYGEDARTHTHSQYSVFLHLGNFLFCGQRNKELNALLAKREHTRSLFLSPLSLCGCISMQLTCSEAFCP